VENQGTADDAIDISTIPPDAVRCVTGLAYKRIGRETGGPRPGPEDIVEVRYQARSEDGRVIERSDAASAPHTWSLRFLIPGLAEAIQLLARGEKLRAWIPPHLSSDILRARVPGNVIFDLELTDFTRVTEPPTLPNELRSP
jgi:FKBP-type peptidyl-prolyl cis-trans isomerase FkpA